MSEDERIDQIIRSAASEYNRPPATPVDEMWTAIQTAHQAATAGPRLHVAASGASSSAPAGYRTRGRMGSRYTWLGMAAAAVLLVVTGVGIGRWTSRDADSTRRVADAPSNAPMQITGDGVPVPAPRADEGPPEVAAPAPAGNGDSRAATNRGGAQGSEPTRGEAPRTGRSFDEIRRNPVVRGSGQVNRLAGNTPASADASSAISYQVATTRHLADAEALLTSFSIESRDERMNSQFAGWAKGLLSNTRLLLDSPAGDDPRRARLLEDLEMVLAQIVQLSPNAAAQDRELIQGTLQDGQVMTRLRTAIPAGQPRAITER